MRGLPFKDQIVIVQCYKSMMFFPHTFLSYFYVKLSAYWHYSTVVFNFMNHKEDWNFTKNGNIRFFKKQLWRIVSYSSCESYLKII
jgi:hypothetical protein